MNKKKNISPTSRNYRLNRIHSELTYIKHQFKRVERMIEDIENND